MALSIGIVGLPNVGKSTLFTALTNRGGVATKFPFASVEANVGTVEVPDGRLQQLADIVHPGRIVPATVEFVDIAGLARGSSLGEGLGNQFLARIRETDALVEVLRYFTDDEVVHVEGSIDPPRDQETLTTELVLADLGTIERALPRLAKEAKKDKASTEKYQTIESLQEWMNEGRPARDFDFSPVQREQVYDLHLLTMKPILLVANVDETEASMVPQAVNGFMPLPICARAESEIAQMEANEAQEFFELLGISESGLARLAQAAYELLGLMSYFTAGEMEVKAWTIPIGAKAPQAAGVIHSDFERGFIKAEVASFADYIAYNGEAGLKAAGRLRQEGKEYVVQEGDVIHFKFNV
ncbi:MAG: redox-regulated ATPase YchF [Coriobacteriales bacterium]|nr:redox-regulated ATPase YchF [Coriobacteriales bacterium]